jgi:polar amino acid transport system ATP-binding protein
MITIENLHKTFASNPVLKGINLKVSSGQTIGILGSSGSGKSTLLRCIQGLDHADQGTISLSGRVGMIFQHFNLFPHMTVLENIIYAPTHVLKKPREDAVQKAKKLLEMVNLSDKADAYPRALSGGQKQRVAILRALAMEPEILLFDEPTSALDPHTTKEVFTMIQQLAEEKREMTFLIVSHELKFVKKIAQRILFLHEGRILEDSPAEDFFSGPKTEEAKKFLHMEK